MKCKYCGCTPKKACVINGKPCHWVLRNLCSNPRCMEKHIDATTLYSIRPLVVDEKDRKLIQLFKKDALAIARSFQKYPKQKSIMLPIAERS
jgi:hypothetical protein